MGGFFCVVKSVPFFGPLCAAFFALCVPPMRGTRFYLDLDRASCFETILAHRGLCANPMRGHVHQGNRSWTLLRNHHKKRYPMRAPYAQDTISMEIGRAPCFEKGMSEKTKRTAKTGVSLQYKKFLIWTEILGIYGAPNYRNTRKA